MERKLSKPELVEMLANLDDWETVNDKLHKEFRFANFEDALDFINQVGSIAKSLNHHPEIFNVYNRVVLDINTHDVNGLTKLDFLFAEKVDLLPPNEEAKEQRN